MLFTKLTSDLDVRSDNSIFNKSWQTFNNKSASIFLFPPSINANN